MDEFKRHYLQSRCPNADEAQLSAVAASPEVAATFVALDAVIGAAFSAANAAADCASADTEHACDVTEDAPRSDGPAAVAHSEAQADTTVETLPVSAVEPLLASEVTRWVPPALTPGLGESVPQASPPPCSEEPATPRVSAEGIAEEVPAEPLLASGSTETAAAPQPQVSTEQAIAPESVPAGSSPAAATPVREAAQTEHVRRSLKFVARNLRQGEDVQAEVTATAAGEPFELVGMQIPPSLGLTIDLERKLIVGCPLQSGEFSFPVQYRTADMPATAFRTSELTLLVNADPKLLWKDLPSDRTAPFWKEDSDQCAIQDAGRHIIAARQRGRSHAHVGSFCEDDFRIARLSGGWSVAIVSDGAGSAKYSRLGSRLACEAAMARLTELLGGAEGAEVIRAASALVAADPSGLEQRKGELHNALYKTVGYAAHAALKAHFAEVEKQGPVTAVRELAATLLIAISIEIQGRHLCAAYWVGDGAVAVYEAGRAVHLLGDVDSGEYSGQTRFLDANEVSQAALSKRTKFALVDDFTALVLMTDGVSDAKFETEAKLARVDAWDALWTDLQSSVELDRRDPGIAERLQEWLSFWSPGNHDDRAISIVY